MVAVAECGSVLSASKEVNVSSSSISAAISQLEAELGVQLFVRQHARGLNLTSVGRQFFTEAKQILHNVALLSDLADDAVQSMRGPISIGCFVTLAPLVAASFRRSFMKEFPHVAVTMREGNQVELLAMLARAEIDIAITYDLDIPAGYDFKGLVDLPPQLILAEDDPLGNKTKIDIKDLVDQPMVLLDLPLSSTYFLSLFQEQGLRPQIFERVSNLSSLRSLVANGFGYGLLNISTKTNLAPDGKKLVFRQLVGKHRPMVFGVARMKSNYSSRIVTAFADHIRKRVNASGLPGMS